MSTQDLIKNAQNREYTEFDTRAKELLAKKVAEKLSQKGYFDRLDQAKGIQKVEESQED